MEHRDTEAGCVNGVSLMLTGTFHSVTVSYDESTWSGCCLLGVASHTGPLPPSSVWWGPDRTLQAFSCHLAHCSSTRPRAGWGCGETA